MNKISIIFEQKVFRIDVMKQPVLNPQIIPALLFIAALAIYAVCGSFEMLNSWDDDLYIKLNDTITSFSLLHIKEALTGYYVGNYAPLNILSFMMDYALWKLNPTGYHLENVLLHAMNGCLFYLLLRRLAMSEWQAAAAVWIFLFHPVQVESVAWISQRKNLLAMLFFLTALIAYHTYCQGKPGKRSAYMLALCAMSAATLCKSVTVIFPAVALLHDITCQKTTYRPIRAMLPDKIPFLIIAGITSTMALLSQSPENIGGRTGYPGGTPYTTLLTMTPVLAGYLRECFLPLGLSPFYMITVRSQPDSVFYFAFGLLICVAVVGIYLYRYSRPLLFWYGLFFIALLPVMQIIPLITLKHDRYLYFPLLGFSALIAAAGSKLYEQTSDILVRPLQIIIICIMLSLPLFAFKQTLHWQNDITLWARAIKVDPENRLAWRMLAMSHTRRGEADEASQAFNRLMKLHEKYGPIDEHNYL